MEQREKNGVVQPQLPNDVVKWSILKNIWPFIVIIFMVAASWTSTTVQVSQLKTDLLNTQMDYIAADARLSVAIENEVRVRSELTTMRNEQYGIIQASLAAIQVDLTWIKDSLQDRVIVGGN
jgi:uncharacterized protein (DUF3084 family)